MPPPSPGPRKTLPDPNVEVWRREPFATTTGIILIEHNTTRESRSPPLLMLPQFKPAPAEAVVKIGPSVNRSKSHRTDGRHWIWTYIVFHEWRLNVRSSVGLWAAKLPAQAIQSACAEPGALTRASVALISIVMAKQSHTSYYT